MTLFGAVVLLGPKDARAITLLNGSVPIYNLDSSITDGLVDYGSISVASLTTTRIHLVLSFFG